ncbi:MAG TPA: hypothetical protein PLA18_07275 [Deltaproteobacteria bacterium]|jgi:hypothetical protein|nr:hypothetical protein [Deltaproteobacteria bacterium]
MSNEPQTTTSGNSESFSLTDLISNYYQYLFITIPPIGTLVLEGYVIRYGRDSLPSDMILFMCMDLIPILACLFIITIKNKNSDPQTALIHYKRTGFYIPFIFLFCLLIATSIGWRKEDESIGWFIIMTIPAAYIFSFITSLMGRGMRTIIK